MSVPAEIPRNSRQNETENDENREQNVEIDKTENAENPEVYYEVSEEVRPTAETTKNQRFFKTKKIRFGPLDYQIVTQNLNGPCPLIAIVNALVLKGKLVIPPSAAHVSSSELLTLLTNYLLACAPSEEDKLRKECYENNLEGVMNLMDTLVDGLDVNVKFSDVDAFEFTPALSLFDLVSVRLYHVWLPDPQFPLIYDLIRSSNYNEMIVKMCTDEESDEKELIKAFHEESVSQITFHGLATLMEKMKDGELAVLFQNNHFSTILKRRDEIFKLASDEGYYDQPLIVWETLNSVDGDCIFVNSDFGNFKPAPDQSTTPPTVIRTSEVQIDEIGEEATVEHPPVLVPPPITRRGGASSPPRTVTPQQPEKQGKSCVVM
uniref:Ubiquitin carboxyl-terminal hydrolase n=1 Tax=Caenorhabditis tropicalis TaxID=1561998 RepID=A0A1I7UZ85_9PELO